MAFYQNATFEELLGLIPDPEVIEQFQKWNARKQDKLKPYEVTLDGKIVKAFGDLDFTDGRKSITYETTYGDIYTLKGKRKPKTLILNFIIEYKPEEVGGNMQEMKQHVADLEALKKAHKAVDFSVSEIDVSYNVTIEMLRVTYRGVRDIYVQAELLEANEDDNIY